MATNASGQSLQDFLEEFGFSKFLQNFEEQGVRNTEDLIDVDHDILTNDVGMTNVQAKRMLRKLGEIFTNQVFSPITIQECDLNQHCDEVYRLQAKKGALDIHYQLFTNLSPENKQIGPLNTDQILYCDLVNMICDAERNELGNDMTVELYTQEGYPLACKPISYISKLSDWRLEEYPEMPLLYAVPRLKLYTEKCAKYMTADPLCDGIDSIFIRNTECGFDNRHIRTNCKEATYFQLLKTLQDMTGIPGHLIQLYHNDTLIHSSIEVTLDALNIENQCALEIKLIRDFWTQGKDKNYSFKECKPTWHHEQSTYGTSFFFSCLYSLADWMAECKQNSSDIRLRTLGHIRSMAGCPPLIHALNLIFRKETLTLPHRVAIQECMVLLFKMIKPKIPKLHIPGSVSIKSEQVTEYTNYFWVYFIDGSTPEHVQTEKYSTYNLSCSETFQRMSDPVLVRDVTGCEHIIERSTLSADVSMDRVLVRYLYNYKRMIMSFIGDEAIVWSCNAVPQTCGVDLTGKWKSIVGKCEKYPPLCVHAPLNVKSTQCPRPCMIPIENGNISVYIDNSKDINKPHVYYEVITGQSILFDAHELDRDVKLKQPPCFKRLKMRTSVTNQGLEAITREPEEIIMVILDCSGSMSNPYLDGKSKYHSVVEAFGAFCDRTTAYDLKHIIGLTLFAKNCKLQYPLSENFREFNDQFRVFPPGSQTAVYEAIKFAIQHLNNFTTQHSEFANMPRRILCLTDGYDNHSDVTPTLVTEKVLQNNIKMDCVLLCNEVLYTHAIAKATGGYSFKPRSTQELLNIFEQETMLTLKVRPYRVAAYHLGEEIDLRKQIILPVDTEPDHALPNKLDMRVQTAQKCLARALIQRQLSIHNNTEVTKRILQELSYFQANPHPAIEVFPAEETIDFWRIVLEGPEETPYEGGIFELFIEFNDDYPGKPPNIRFITQIYHCNINSAGRICHTILDRFYAPGVRVRDIFNHVYGLLIDPEPDDPLDSVKATELRCHRTEYLRKAKKHTELHAKARTKRDVRISLLGSDQNMQVNYPGHLICPLTLKLFEVPVTNSDGETYEKEAILEHLRSGKNYDPFTYKELLEEELRPNKAIMNAVTEYKQEIERMGQL